MLSEVYLNKSKIDFFQLTFFKILRNEYGFRAFKFKGKRRFLRYVHGKLIKVPFSDVTDVGLAHIRSNFENYNLGKTFTTEDIENAYYKSRSVKNKEYAFEIFKIDFVPSQEEIDTLFRDN